MIALTSIFVCWCMCKVCERKSHQRIFPSVSNLELRGIGNSDVGIQIEDDQPHTASHSGVKDESKKNEERKKQEKPETKKKQDDRKDKMDSKVEKKWWERPVTLSDLLSRQKRAEAGKEEEKKREEEKEEKGEPEKEKGEPEKYRYQMPDGSFYSPDEDEDDD